jgi:SAM-dependent methyltransferase
VNYQMEDQERMAQARNYFAWQYRIAAKYLGERIIEAGCGAGNFTGHLLCRELVCAVDPEPECVRRVALRFPNARNLRVECCGLPDAAFFRLRDLKPDTCVCLNVIEHIRDDLGALRAMASILPPGGSIVLLAPAFEALYGPIDFALGHYRRYTRRAVARMASAAGLEIVELHYMNLPGFLGWWANARVLRLKAQSLGQITVFDRLAVPLISRIEAIAAPPVGQSVFAALRKPA